MATDSPAGDDLGEIMDTGDDAPDEVEDVKGGSIVRMQAQQQEVDDTEDFYTNLAETIPSTELETLASELLQLIEYDKKAREDRDKQYEEGLKRTGLGKDAPGGASFNGASKVVHPLLVEACVDFASRAIAELLPSAGPVKDFIPGTPTQPRVEKARRKTSLMNWQIKTKMPEFRSELEKLFTQLPLGGSQYLRLVYDSRLKRPVPVFVPIDNVFLPFAATSFYTAERITYVESLTKFEFNRRVAEGMYIDLDLIGPAMIPEETDPEKANNKIEGKTSNQYNEDGLRHVYEVQVHSELEDFEVESGEDDDLTGTPETEKAMRPYLISIDVASRRIIRVTRNWEEEDPIQEPMFWMSEWPFIPWRGAYAIGLIHLIGGLSGAATGALRALLDSAHINNIPTMLRLKGANFVGQSKELEVTEVTEIEGGLQADDIRKLVMPVPFNQPSPVLMELLGFLVNAGKGVVQTTFDKFDENSQNMPVGTTLALIEQGMKVLSAIHLRLYDSMDKTIRILHRINRLYITDEEILDDTGELLAKRSDFEGPLDVIPTANPEIFSDVQRYAQMQLVAQRAQGNPLYNQRKVEEMILERTKIPDAKQLLLPEQQPQWMNAVNENVAMSLGRPVAAFPEQDHLAHIQVLLDFYQSPMFGSSPLIAPVFTPAMMQHLKEHLVLWYVNHYFETISSASDQPIEDVLKHQDPETRKELDRTLAAASSDIIDDANSTFSKIPPIIQKAQQVMAQLQQQAMASTPPDPASQALITTKKLDVESKDRQIAANAQEKEKDRQTTMQETAVKEQGDNQRNTADNVSREKINVQDNTTAATIAQGEFLTDDHVGLENGNGINPAP